MKEDRLCLRITTLDSGRESTQEEKTNVKIRTIYLSYFVGLEVFV